MLPTMSVDEARSVIWPFRDLKGQTIGTLLDKGSLSLQDLGFAAERARNSRLRNASKTLLLHSLSQVSEDTLGYEGTLNVISSQSRTFAERRQLFLVLTEGTILGIGMGVGIAVVIHNLFFRTPTENTESTNVLLSTMTGTIFLIATLAVMIILSLLVPYKLIDLLMSRIDQQIQLYRKGQLGEDRVVTAMYHFLDGEWTLFRNVEVPGARYGDFDLVLVGPYGVWCMEVKSYSGLYRNLGEKWERYTRGKWLPAWSNPTRQAKRHAAALGHVLKTHEIDQWIQPIIIWANPESNVKLENPSVFVWTLDQTGDRLKQLSNERPIGEYQQQRIISVLSDLIKTQQDT
jgi:hypothetical protein